MSSDGRLGRSSRIVDDYLTVRDLLGRRVCGLRQGGGVGSKPPKAHLATYCLASRPITPSSATSAQTTARSKDRKATIMSTTLALAALLAAVLSSISFLAGTTYSDRAHNRAYREKQ